MNKNCENCGKSFETQNLRKIFCSGGCKTDAHRKKHGIEKPAFLTTSLEIAPKKKVPVTKEIEKFKSIPNPIFVEKKAELALVSKNLEFILKEKQNKINKYTSLVERNKDIIGGLIGATGGALLGLIGTTTADKLILGGLGALVFGYLGTAVGKSLNDADTQNLKLINEIKKLQQEINELEQEGTRHQITVTHISNELKKTKKFNEEKYLEKYTEYIEIEEEIIPKIALPAKLADKKEIVKGMISVGDFKNITIKTFDFAEKSQEFYEILGNPAENFRMMIYGQNFNGKSTYAILLAKFLCENFGRVLYNSSEEGISISLQNKVKEINSDLFDISSCRSGADLISLLKKTDKKPRFLFIDSINDMNITNDDLKKIIELDSNRAIIWIMQATKGGDFKGKNEFAHEADIRIKIEHYKPIIEKNRYK